MISIRIAIGSAVLTLLSAAAATAAPAYVKSTVNLRAGAGTNHEIVGKIPAGSLVDASKCAEGWCEVEWQGKLGFAIATALDTSGRVPIRAAPVRAEAPDVESGLGEPIYPYQPPAYHYRRPYYYGYPRYYGGPYWGYRRYYW